MPHSELMIRYADEHLVAVDKPHNLFVHQTNLDRSQKDSLTDRLRQQLNEIAYPLHRLDRPTSGLVLFGRHKEVVRVMSYAFSNRLVHKYYSGIVRGHLDPKGTIDYPLRRHNKKQMQTAITSWRTRFHGELDIAVPPHETARYSFVQFNPETGRWHQLRRHCAHLRHPLIGDTSHGDARHNRLFRTQFGVSRLYLHAHGLRFPHPLDNEREIHINSPLPAEFTTVAHEFGWDLDGLSELFNED